MNHIEQFRQNVLAIARIQARLRQISSVTPEQRMTISIQPSKELWDTIHSIESGTRRGTLWGHGGIVAQELMDACIDELRERGEWPSLIEELLGQKRPKKAKTGGVQL